MRKSQIAAVTVATMLSAGISSAAAHQGTYVLTGLGATRAAWDAHHVAVTKYIKGTVYDPDPSVPGGNRYIEVNTAALHSIPGRVTGYEMQMANVPLSQAKTLMKAQLPPDAKLASFKTLSACAYVTYRSAILGQRTKPKGSPYATFELGSGPAEDSYNTSSIDDAIVNLGKPLPGVGC